MPNLPVSVPQHVARSPSPTLRLATARQAIRLCSGSRRPELPVEAARCCVAAVPEVAVQAETQKSSRFPSSAVALGRGRSVDDGRNTRQRHG